MPDRWVPDKKGEEILLENLAAGFDAWVQVVEDRIRDVERSLERYHFSGAKTPRVPYPETIDHATYLNGALVGGTNVRGAARPKGDTIHARVYTTSFLGHMLELTGAKPHDIPIPLGPPGMFIIVHHPGFAPRRHFAPGLLLAVASVGATMQAKINARQGAQGSHRMARTFVGNE